MRVLANGCRVVLPHEGKWQSEGKRRYRTPINRANGARDIAQTISHYECGIAPVRRNAASEEVLYVFSGSGIGWIDGIAHDLRTGSAIYIPPQAQYQIENPNDDLLEIVSVCCPEEANVTMSTEIAERLVNTGDARRFVIHESDRAAIPTGDRSFHLLVHQDLGCERVSELTQPGTCLGNVYAHTKTLPVWKKALPVLPVSRG